jgi:hypothetical protein
MVDRARRELVVCGGGDIVGIVSMRNPVRCWAHEGANCELPKVTAQSKPDGHLARSKPGSQTSPPSNADIDAAKVDYGQEVLNSVLGHRRSGRPPGRLVHPTATLLTRSSYGARSPDTTVGAASQRP